MKHLNTATKLIICIFLLGCGQPVSAAVKQALPNIEALWRQYLRNDAAKLPAIRYPYDHCFRSAARQYDLPVSLLLAVARGESDFNPRARSDRNCHGLMQIQWPGTARHLGIYRLTTLYEPCPNIRAGAAYLRELLDRFGDNLHLALAAYNYGPGRIANRIGAGHIPPGAKWYSSYIYHHLNHILQGASPVGTVAYRRPVNYRQPQQIALITFTQPYRAEAYYQHLQERAPGLNLDWFRIGLGRYQVVLRYSDNKALQKGKKRLRNLGVFVNGR